MSKVMALVISLTTTLLLMTLTHYFGVLFTVLTIISLLACVQFRRGMKVAEDSIND